MKKRTCVFIVSLVLFCFAHLAFAEVVYLKNGTVMIGRIVEKNEKFIVLKNGEGVNAITTTIFSEDINKIESQEVYSQKVSLIPFKLLPKESRSFEINKAAPLSRPEQETASVRLKNLVDGSQQYLMSQRAKNLVFQENGEPAQEPDRNSMKLYLEESQKKNESAFLTAVQAMPQEVDGNGGIAGTITLPKDREKFYGPLYVYLMREAGGGKFITTKKLLFTKIRAEDVLGAQIPYAIEHVPPGKYKVFVQWDVAPPSVRLESIGENQVLTFLGTVGDYTGMTTGAVTLLKDEKKMNINFLCNTLIETNRINFYVGERPEFQIENIYYRRTDSGINKIVLSIKNTGLKAINILVFDVYINDQKLSSIPLDFNNIGPGKEREFDITSFYMTYLKMVEERKIPAGPEKVVKIKLVWPSTKEVEFEKVLFIF